MSEIRGQLINLLRFPRALPGVGNVWQLAQWIQGRRESDDNVAPAWRVMEDTDRALILIPVGGPEPGFVITPVEGEYEVLICDPDDIDELGPFDTLADALDGISAWLSLTPQFIGNDACIAEDEPVAQDEGAVGVMDNFRAAFPVNCPASLYTMPLVRES